MSKRVPTDVAVSVIVPAFNDADSLPELIQRIATTLEQAAGPFEIIVCDDASTDATSEVLAELLRWEPRLVVRRRTRRGGRSVALREGFQLARGTAIVTLYADGQVGPEQITCLLDGIKRGCDVVTGCRGSLGRPFHRRVIARVRRAFLELLTGLPDRDWGSAFRAYRRHAVSALLRSSGAAFALPDLLDLQGFTSMQIPVSTETRGRNSLLSRRATSTEYRWIDLVTGVLRQRFSSRRTRAVLP